MSKIIRTHRIEIRTYDEVNIKGIISKRLIDRRFIDGAIMPAALTEMSDAATEIARIEQEGKRISDYRKMYTKKVIDELEIIAHKGEEFVVLKKYDYADYGFNGNHYKTIIVKVER